MAQSQPKYILTERIAQGGMAEIHLGKLVGSDGFARACAFKRILPHYAQDNEFIEMFRNEANVAKQLQNKNIVQVFDFVSDGSSYMLVLEFVDGQDLRGVLSAAEQKGKRIPIELACFIAMETLLGLSYAHSAVDVTGKSMGIIHRDVSPQNILLSYDGDIKLTDFGIAKAGSQNSNTRVGVLKGKFRYMSPEQASGYNIDARTDLFAVGIILYEMLTMARLFKGEDLAVLEAVRKCAITPPSQMAGNGHIPQELDAIVMKLLSKELHLRYQSGREAVRDLSKFLYKCRPDFFVGELADYLKDLFREKLEAARERLRSTLALPTGQFDTFLGTSNVFGDKIESKNQSQVVDLTSSGTNIRGSSRTSAGSVRASGTAVALGQSQRDRSGSGNSSLSLPMRSRGRVSGSSADGVAIPRSRVAASPSAPLPASIFFEPAKGVRSGSQSMLFPVLVLLIAVAALFTGLVYVRNRNQTTPATLQIKTVPADIRMIVEVNGQPINEGKPLGFPSMLTLPSGSHKILLTRPGFKSKELLVDLASGASRDEVVRLETERLQTVSVEIITMPEGAALVSEEGWGEGRTPHTIHHLPVHQKLRFRLKHPNCRDVPIELSLNKRDAVQGLVKRRYELRGCKR